MSDPQNPQSGRQLESFHAASLLRPSSATAFDPIKHAQVLAARSKWFCVALTIVTVLTWMVACFMAMIVADDYAKNFHNTVLHPIVLIAEGEKAPDNPPPPTKAQIQDAYRRQGEEMMLFAWKTIAVFGVAALLSIWLIIASRRVALRQINANLLAIAIELRKLLPEATPQSG